MGHILRVVANAARTAEIDVGDDIDAGDRSRPAHPLSSLGASPSRGSLRVRHAQRATAGSRCRRKQNVRAASRHIS